MRKKTRARIANTLEIAWAAFIAVTLFYLLFICNLWAIMGLLHTGEASWPPLSLYGWFLLFGVAYCFFMFITNPAYFTNPDYDGFD